MSCAPAVEGVDAPLADLTVLESPAAVGSGEPHLFATAQGRVYLSWLEDLGDGVTALRLAAREQESGWGEVRTVSEGRHWFVNWADIPSVVALPDGTLAAHWLVRSGPGTYAYDVHIARSIDDGVSWSESVIPHRDGTETEHGFVSLFPWRDGRLAAVWLDGRKSQGGGGHGASSNEMTLRHTLIGADGSLSEDVLLDDRICDCCQTGAAVTADGPVVVYRDRSDAEVRDIAITRFVDGTWTAPTPVHEDGWTIAACPVNGPFVAADGRRVVVAWFTAAQDQPVVRVAFSDDAGATFEVPARVDDGDPIGRVATALLADGSALVSWLERVDGSAEVMVRRVWPNGTASDPFTVAVSAQTRASGFPRMAVAGGHVYFAWTEPGDQARVRVATARVPGP